MRRWRRCGATAFLLTPLREGRQAITGTDKVVIVFLLTPLREGRHFRHDGGVLRTQFLLTPLREGRRDRHTISWRH